MFVPETGQNLSGAPAELPRLTLAIALLAIAAVSPISGRIEGETI